MSRFHSYINTAVKLIDKYNGEIPFSIFIKKYFSTEKKYGSKDRKQIAALCYNYYRLGLAANNLSVENKIILATFLCESESTAFMDHINPEWNKKINAALEDKIELVKADFLLTEIFPFSDEMSDDVSVAEFNKSMLVKPSVFFRIRPQSRQTTLKKLQKSKLEYELIGEDCVRLTDVANLEDYFLIDKEIVVQDYNSQKVLDYLKEPKNASVQNVLQSNVKIWDCCAASGGKSILINDICKGKIDLTISDIRPAIILNLHQRFKKAAIKEYHYFIADIGNNNFAKPAINYHLIICDAPCTGSGTWSRTPEQLQFFNKKTIDDYNQKQRKIVANIIPCLQPEGLLVYITCSVFKKENESIASFIKSEYNLELLHMELLKGYNNKADSMFVAIFKKPAVIA